jgi:hypothetical protein
MAGPARFARIICLPAKQDPAIHALMTPKKEDVDARTKSGHDGCKNELPFPGARMTAQ